MESNYSNRQDDDLNRFRGILSLYAKYNNSYIVAIRVRPFLDDEMQNAGEKGKYNCAHIH